MREVWPLHRVATSGRYHDPLHVIETEWSVRDLLVALDVIEELDRVASEE